MKKKRRRSKARRLALLEELDPGGGGSDEEILTAISDEALLFHTPSRESFASVPVGEHRENWPVASREFAFWLTMRFFQERRRAPNPALLRETLYQIEARAQFGRSSCAQPEMRERSPSTSATQSGDSSR